MYFTILWHIILIFSYLSWRAYFDKVNDLIHKYIYIYIWLSQLFKILVVGSDLTVLRFHGRGGFFSCPKVQVRTLMACWMKSTVINIPKSSPATRVNRLIMSQALNIASRNSNRAVHTHTLQPPQLQRFNYKPSRFSQEAAVNISLYIFREETFWRQFSSLGFHMFSAFHIGRSLQYMRKLGNH